MVSSVGREGQGLVRALLRYDPSKRPSAKQVGIRSRCSALILGSATYILLHLSAFHGPQTPAETNGRAAPTRSRARRNAGQAYARRPQTESRIATDSQPCYEAYCAEIVRVNPCTSETRPLDLSSPASFPLLLGGRVNSVTGCFFPVHSAFSGIAFILV